MFVGLCLCVWYDWPQTEKEKKNHSQGNISNTITDPVCCFCKHKTLTGSFPGYCLCILWYFPSLHQVCVRKLAVDLQHEPTWERVCGCALELTFEHVCFLGSVYWLLFWDHLSVSHCCIGKVAVKKEDLQKYHGKDTWFQLQPVSADSEVQVSAERENTEAAAHCLYLILCNTSRVFKSVWAFYTCLERKLACSKQIQNYKTRHHG